MGKKFFYNLYNIFNIIKICILLFLYNILVVLLFFVCGFFFPYIVSYIVTTLKIQINCMYYLLNYLQIFIFKIILSITCSRRMVVCIFIILHYIIILYILLFYCSNNNKFISTSIIITNMQR